MKAFLFGCVAALVIAVAGMMIPDRPEDRSGGRELDLANHGFPAAEDPRSLPCAARTMAPPEALSARHSASGI